MALSSAQRQSRLLTELHRQSLFSAYLNPDLRPNLEAEAKDPDLPDRSKLIRLDMLEKVQQLLADPERKPDLISEHPGVSARSVGLFFSTDLVVIVPGFLGSTLSDVQTAGYGLIWVNPNIAFRDRLGLLQLAPYASPERDKDSHVKIEATGVLPIIYDLLRADLEPRRYSVALFPVDWRKNLEEAAEQLCGHLQKMINGSKQPIHVVAHSQGALVARRGIQLLAKAMGQARVLDRLKNLVLLGPANYGTFSAAFALAGTADLIRRVSPFIVSPEQGFPTLLQSMSGIYQLLPWDTDRLPNLGQSGHQVGRADFWKPTIDADRLTRFFGWGKDIDTSFLAKRTTVILGDNYSSDGTGTIAGVSFVHGELRATHVGQGDGTILDCCAYLAGAATYRAHNTEHLRLPTYPHVLRAVRQTLGGDRPSVSDDFKRVTEAEALAPVRALSQSSTFAAVTDTTPSSVQTGQGSSPSAQVVPHQPTAPAAPIRDPKEARQPLRRIPTVRRLRAFAFDPLLSRTIDSSSLNLITLAIPWEERLEPGPVGEYLEVIDVDPTNNRFYPPVDLNHPELLAQDGMAPSEGHPQFHQQMVYAVAMATIRTFEQAIGRRATWAPHFDHTSPDNLQRQFVQRLRIYPHALREANAYYSPEKKALLFGYFRAPATSDGLIPPSGTIFACLSHDIVAHETTHALLDGMHRYFHESSNQDVLAFHEAFADIVALLQHFSLSDMLRDQIARTHGDIAGQENLLGALAVEFGKARGLDGALRDAIGEYHESVVDGVKKKAWIPHIPHEDEYQKATEPHQRGAVLVAAVFDAYLTIYKRRATPLIRLATGGTGVLPAGDLHPELISHLADEAAKVAGHVLQMCVRALDYCPPVDITFGEYLRALITADADLVPDDDLHYRLAVVSAFARRGIYPPDVRNLSVESLLWRSPSETYRLDGDQLSEIRHLSSITAEPTDDRKSLDERMRDDAARVHSLILIGALPKGFDRFLGISLDRKAPASIDRDQHDRPKFEVHAVRPSYRVGPDGQSLAELVIEITQRRLGYLDPKVQKTADSASDPKSRPAPDFIFRGGCTLIIDLKAGCIRYAVVKDILDEARLTQQRGFQSGIIGDQALELTFLANGSSNGHSREPFAVMHRV